MIRAHSPMAHVAADPFRGAENTDAEKDAASRYVRRAAGELAEEWLAALGLEGA